MTDDEIIVWLMALVAGKDPLNEKAVTLASAEWPKDKHGHPDLSRLPPIISLQHRCQGDGMGGTAVWWDFRGCLAEIRRWFPYKEAPRA